MTTTTIPMEPDPDRVPGHEGAHLARLSSQHAAPKRIQRRRAARWRMPAGVVYVGRPTRWGNPFGIDRTRASRAGAVALYRQWLADRPALVAAARAELAGRDLACWCPLDRPCHADVLIELANPTTDTPEATS